MKLQLRAIKLSKYRRLFVGVRIVSRFCLFLLSFCSKTPNTHDSNQQPMNTVSIVYSSVYPLLQPPPFACLMTKIQNIDTYYNGIGKRIDHMYCTIIVQSTATAAQVQQIDIIDNSVVSSPTQKFVWCCFLLVWLWLLCCACVKWRFGILELIKWRLILGTVPYYYYRLLLLNGTIMEVCYCTHCHVCVLLINVLFVFYFL